MTSDPKALVFDVFGTVVDWRSTIVREGEELGRKKGFDVDWSAFADAWRSRYAPSMDRVRRGEIPWTNLDALHRASLEELLGEFGVEGLTAAFISTEPRPRNRSDRTTRRRHRE
jgi:2-haloacid dehalogenase